MGSTVTPPIGVGQCKKACLCSPRPGTKRNTFVMGCATRVVEAVIGVANKKRVQFSTTAACPCICGVQGREKVHGAHNPRQCRPRSCRNVLIPATLGSRFEDAAHKDRVISDRRRNPPQNGGRKHNSHHCCLITALLSHNMYGNRKLCCENAGSVPCKCKCACTGG